MLFLMSPILSICVPPLMLLLHLWQTLCLSYFSSDELSSYVPSSSFIEDVSSSPSVEPSSLVDSSLEQLIRRSHRLHQPLTITLLLLS
jgi:hypothetical protein